MYLQQFYLEDLGHASYLVGSEETGEAFVLDVRRDVETYFQAAREQAFRIRYAAHTHQHNDYVTGICELPSRGDVELLAGPTFWAARRRRAARPRPSAIPCRTRSCPCRITCRSTRRTWPARCAAATSAAGCPRPSATSAA